MTVRELLARIACALGRGPHDEDVRQELAFHAAMLEERHRHRGLDADAARRAARLELGNPAPAVEAWRDQHGLPWLDSLRQDVRYGLRTLRRTPGFTAAALATLTIGIGANTAMFSVVDAVLLQRLPYADPDRLVTVGDRAPDGSSSNVGFATVVDWRERSRAFDGLAVERLWMPTLVSAGEAERLTALRVSWNYFDLLGARPLVGRTFVSADDRPDDWYSVVLSEGLWRRRFNADPEIVGRTIALGGRPYRVLGVMHAGFRSLDAEQQYGAEPQVWAALGYDARSGAASGACRSCQHLRAIGRLRAGVTLTAATAEMDTIRSQMQREHPADYEAGSIAIVPLADAVSGRARRALLVLLGAVGCVLLIACANVAGLQLARAASRRQELTIRAALGAGRGRVIRQLLTENLLLAGAGAAFGAAAAALGVRALVRLSPVALPRLDQAGVDGRVLAFTAVTAVTAGVLFGLAPALRAAAAGRASSLVVETRGAVGGGSARAALVVADFAMALVLLAGAMLMLRTMAAMAAVDPGFRPAGVLSLQFSLAGGAFPDERSILAFQHTALERLRGLPGVERAALAGQVPFGGVRDCWGFHARDRMQANTADDPCVERYGFAGDYLGALGIPLVAGRSLTEADSETAAPVILVSQSTAATVWRGANPIGAQVRIGGAERGPWRTVVGIVGDVHHDDLTAAPGLAMYTPEAQIPSAYLTAVLRSRDGDAAPLASAARAAIRQLSAEVPIYGIEPLSTLVGDSASVRRFVLRLLAGFALIAVLLAAVGLYGVVSYGVAERTREVGLRMALGAQRSDVLRLVVTNGLLLVAAGIAGGLAAAALVTRYLGTLVFGVSATDPLTFAAAASLLISVALLAHWIPVRRALRIEPARALRAE